MWSRELIDSRWDAVIGRFGSCFYQVYYRRKLKISYRSFILSPDLPYKDRGFCPLLKRSSAYLYLKIIDFSQLLVADTHMNFVFQNSVHPLTALLGHPIQK